MTKYFQLIHLREAVDYFVQWAIQQHTSPSEQQVTITELIEKYDELCDDYYTDYGLIEE